MSNRLHGTRSRYVVGCRCVRCRRANAEYQRAYARLRAKRSSAPRLHSENGTKGASPHPVTPAPENSDDVSAGMPPAEDYPAHVHKPVPHAPYVEYVPVQRQRTYTCATCGCALFVIPTPEEADEYDRVLEAQIEERQR